MIMVDIEAQDLGYRINVDVCDELQASANNGMYRIIKVNIPKDSTNEGCWVLVSHETYTLVLDDNNHNTECKSILLNNSVFYPGLLYGTVIPFITNGDKRPFVNSNWLKKY